MLHTTLSDYVDDTHLCAALIIIIIKHVIHTTEGVQIKN